jgi:TetR/AcrR family transcriptional regulator, transcriptional repressor for nem operon
MRASREAAAESKARIVEAASTMLRERGVDGASIADMMEAAGMTHGGFYKHFGSKDELVAAAVRRAFAEISDRFDAREEKGDADSAAAAYVEEYLSRAHIERPGRGCPVAALGGDAARHPQPLAGTFAIGAEALITRLSRSKTRGRKSGANRARAIRRLTALVGTVVVARAVGPGPLRDEILAASAGLEAAREE